MNRSLRATLAVIFVVIIMFATITIFQSIGRRLRIDFTEHGLYTLSDGTRSIVKKINQPIKITLYYAETAALKEADWIKRWHRHYLYVKSLLEEYVSAAEGRIELEIIDPRPFSEQEEEALRQGLRRFDLPGREDEFFIFGLTVRTEFGRVESIEYLDPGRDRYVEYDVTSLIDTAITREKSKIGVLSSLPVLGDDLTPYMIQLMRMQGQRPRGPWMIIEQLREKYDVERLDTETDKIEGVDMLLVVHPKDLPDKTLFAIDQFVLGGGPTVVCVDPFCYADQPPRQMGMAPTGHKSGSNLKPLLGRWGLEMPDNTYAADFDLAQEIASREGGSLGKLITYLNLGEDCMNPETIISGQLSDVTVLAAGALRKTGKADNLKLLAVIQTTSTGNTIRPASESDMIGIGGRPNTRKLMEQFIEGTKPVTMGYLVTGRPKSAFPEGIEIRDEEADAEKPEDDESAEPESRPATAPASKPAPKRRTGLTEAAEDVAVVVFSDVDFLTDPYAYRDMFNPWQGRGDNAALLFNAIDQLSGSPEMISLRSRGSFRRRFEVVADIERQAEKETAEEEKRINADIEHFREELSKIFDSTQGRDDRLIEESVLQKKRELEEKLRSRQRDLRLVQMERRERIERLGMRLRNLNIIAAPALTLLVAIALAAYRTARGWHFVRTRQPEASDMAAAHDADSGGRG